MKTTGIIMSGNHPQLILDGTKTMTRRTWGLEKINENPDDWYCLGLEYVTEGLRWHFESGSQSPHTLFIKNPYGDVGDQLWVREVFQVRADKVIEYRASSRGYVALGPWKPSIHMFKKDSRITLEIIAGSRAERLQEIKPYDAIMEGIFHDDITDSHFQPVHDFRYLWDSLNAKRGYGWDFNPWVFVSPFKLGGTC